MVVFLAQRSLVGVVLGSVASTDLGAGTRQIACLMALFLLFFIYLVTVRPFLARQKTRFKTFICIDRLCTAFSQPNSYCRAACSA